VARRQRPLGRETRHPRQPLCVPKRSYVQLTQLALDQVEAGKLERGGTLGKRAKSRAAAIALALWGGSTQVQGDTVAAHLGQSQVRLWYQETGRLSEDIAPPKTVGLWNTIIGEGGAEENADDALFIMEIRTTGEQNIAQPLTLTATNKSGKILAQRTFKTILTSEMGTAVLPLWVKDIGCAGTVVFSAAMGVERRTFSIDFPCGE
jgi:hypothetical protein